MKINYIIIIFFLVIKIFCIFDEEIEMEKSVEGNGLFLEKLDDNNYYVSNSVSNFIFNIRNGEKTPFNAIIPLSSSVFEPFIIRVNNIPSYFVDGFSDSGYLKIFNISSNKYKEFTGLNLNEVSRRKFCKFGDDSSIYSSFVIGVEDKNNFFHVRLITANGTEVFVSQTLDISGSDDFSIITQISGYYKSIIAIIFYENVFVMHQWYRYSTSDVYYSTDQAITNQFIKQNFVQNTKSIFCGQEFGDVNCHLLKFNYNAGFNTKTTNVQMLQECKSNFKLIQLNNERYAVSCLNINNEYIIQLFTEKLVRDFDMDGRVIFADHLGSEFDYNVIKARDNEIVILKADIPKNKYFIDTFSFIKNDKNTYQLCPEGCQNCYFIKQLGIRYPNNTYVGLSTLNCSLCTFNRYFADSYGDICFLKKDRPKGYEFIEKYKKFSSCEYCCKVKSNDDEICDICLNEYKYQYYIDEENKGRCQQKCNENYGFIRYDGKICTSSCNGTQDCCSFNSYLDLIKDLEGTNNNTISSGNSTNNTNWRSLNANE